MMYQLRDYHKQKYQEWSSHLFYCTYTVLYLSTISSHVFISFTRFMNNQIIHKNSIGISLPKDIIEKIDVERGDIARSKFILRLIESSLKLDTKR